MTTAALAFWLAISLTTGVIAMVKTLRIRRRDLGPRTAQRSTPALRALYARWFAALTFNTIGCVIGIIVGAQGLVAVLQTHRVWDWIMLMAAIGLESIAVVSMWGVTSLRTTVQGPRPPTEGIDEYQ